MPRGPCKVTPEGQSLASNYSLHLLRLLADILGGDRRRGLLRRSARANRRTQRRRVHVSPISLGPREGGPLPSICSQFALRHRKEAWSSSYRNSRLEPDSKDNYRASRLIAIWIDARTT